jgi:sigma-E factor negative regulatory protein RseC
MLIETGRVVAVEQDSLWVETIRQSTCGGCAVRKGCGHSLMNRVYGGRRSYVRVLPGKHHVADCEVNDQVRISIPEEVILRGSAIVYLLPLVGMLLGALAAAHLLPGTQDLPAAGGAVAGFLAGIALVRWHAARHRGDTRFQPTLVEICATRSGPARALEPPVFTH